MLGNGLLNVLCDDFRSVSSQFCAICTHLCAHMSFGIVCMLTDKDSMLNFAELTCRRTARANAICTRGQNDAHNTRDIQLVGGKLGSV